MASLQSRMWKFFLSPLYATKANASAELNIRFARLIEAPLPTKSALKKNDVKTIQIRGRNMFTLIPPVLRDDKIIFYLHGGAYIAGIAWPHWRFIQKIANMAGVKVVLPDYPVAPENSHADTFDMATAAYEKLLEEFSPSQIIFMGDSAGGGLALALAQSLKKVDLPQPSKMILLCPWLDVTLSNPDIGPLETRDSLLSRKVLVRAGEHYANGTDRTIPEISPIYGSFDGLAEIHLFTGTHELLHADAGKLHAKLKAREVRFKYYEYDQMFHVWMLFPIPEAQHVMNRIMGIIKASPVESR